MAGMTQAFCPVICAHKARFLRTTGGLATASNEGLVSALGSDNCLNTLRFHDPADLYFPDEENRSLVTGLSSVGNIFYTSSGFVRLFCSFYFTLVCTRLNVSHRNDKTFPFFPMLRLITKLTR